MNALPNPFHFQDQDAIDRDHLRALAGIAEREFDRAGMIGRIAVAKALNVPIEEEPVELPAFLGSPRREYLTATELMPIVKTLAPYSVPPRYRAA